MIELDQVNKKIKGFGGQEISSELFDLKEAETLEILKWECRRDEFPDEAEPGIVVLIALNAILGQLGTSTFEKALNLSKSTDDKGKIQSVNIENTRVDFADSTDADKAANLINDFENKINYLYNKYFITFCNRYRCLQC